MEVEAADAVRAALPAGWSVLRTVRSSVPDGWVTGDGGGTMVEGWKGEVRFRVWFLPRDWIGICPRSAEQVWRRHAFGVQLGERWKCIVLCDDGELVRTLGRGLGQTASFINSGAHLAMELFGADLAAVDAKARALVEAHCILETDRIGAVDSLLLLGVPAPSLFREEALRGYGETAGRCASALCEFPGRETVEVLSRVVAEKGNDEVVKPAAMALEFLADRAAGPALMRALRRVRWSEAAEHVTGALERIRWTEAAPLVLRRMEGSDSPFEKARYAKALASFRYEPALPEIRKLAGEIAFTSEWIRGEARSTYLGWVPGVALLRMTGPWGEPVGGLRMCLLAPETVEPGKKPEIALVLENVGDEDRCVIEDLEGKAIVDGEPFEQIFGWDGFAELRVNEVWVWTLLLPESAAEPGKHRIRFESGEARSNEIEVVVPAAR
jgi:hypothetical protein